MQLGFSVTPTVRYTNEIKEKFENSLALHSVMISLSLYSLHFLNHCLLNPLKTNNSQACLGRWCEKVESLRWSKLKAVLTKTAVHVALIILYLRFPVTNDISCNPQPSRCAGPCFEQAQLHTCIRRGCLWSCPRFKIATLYLPACTVLKGHLTLGLYSSYLKVAELHQDLCASVTLGLNIESHP